MVEPISPEAWEHLFASFKKIRNRWKISKSMNKFGLNRINRISRQLIVHMKQRYVQLYVKIAHLNSIHNIFK